MAERYLVDTGVFVRWFLQQVGHPHAREVRTSFLRGEVSLETVDFVRYELGHVLRNQGLLKGRLGEKEYVAANRAVDDLGIKVHLTDVDALERTAELAARRMVRFFDAMLIDRALVADLPVLTSDRRLANAIDGLVTVEILRGVP